MVKKQNIISILERNINDFSFDNITFQTTINCDPTILEILKACKSRLRLLRYIFALMATLSTLILFLLLLHISKNLKEYPFLSVVLISITELIILINIVATMNYSPINIPVSYHIFVHEPSRSFKTLVIVTRFSDKNKLDIIPLDEINEIIFDTTKEIVICKHRIITSEINIVDKDGKLLVSFGAYGIKVEVQKAARELWLFLKLHNYIK